MEKAPFLNFVLEISILAIVLGNNHSNPYIVYKLSPGVTN